LADLDTAASGAEWLHHQFQIEQIAPNILHDLFAVVRLDLGIEQELDGPLAQ
jgi:hypothetical protein